MTIIHDVGLELMIHTDLADAVIKAAQELFFCKFCKVCLVTQVVGKYIF